MKTFLLNVLIINISISVLIFVLILSRNLLKRQYAAKMRYWLWLFIALKLMLPFNFILPSKQAAINVPLKDYTVYTSQLPATQFTEKNFDNTKTDTVTQDETASQAPQEQKLATIYISDILCLIWFAVSALLMSYTLLCYRKEKARILRFAVRDDDIAHLAHSTAYELGISRKFDVVCSNLKISPMLMGIIKPIIVIPKRNYTQYGLKMILRHELIHLKRWDIAYKFILHTVSCIYWFNPLVYIMSKMSNDDIEFSCDEAALKNQNKQFRTEYVQTIMEIINMKNNFVLTTAFSGNKNVTKERFCNIFSAKTLKNGRSLIAIFLTAIMVCPLLISCSAAKQPGSGKINGLADNLGVITLENPNGTDGRIVSPGYTGYGMKGNEKQFDGDTFYFSAMSENGTKYGQPMLTYIKENGEHGIACTKDGCAHKNSSCDAFMDSYYIYFTISNQLYAFDNGYESKVIRLYKLDTDNHNQKQLVFEAKHYTKENGDIATDYENIYFSVVKYNDTDNAVVGRSIQKLNLHTGKMESIWDAGDAWSFSSVGIKKGIAIVKSYGGDKTEVLAINLSNGQSQVITSFYQDYSTADFAVADDIMYTVDGEADVVKTYNLFTGEEKILMEGVKEKLNLSGKYHLTVSKAYDNYLTVTVGIETGEKYGKTTAYGINLDSLQVKELTITGADDGGFIVPVRLFAQIGDSYVIASNYPSAMVADFAVITKEDYWNSNPEIISAGTYTIS